jgi:hypothetical protein
MKNKLIRKGILLIVLVFFGLVFIGCPTDKIMNGNPVIPDDNGPDIPNNPPAGTVDPAFWFIEIYEKLVERVGEVSSDGYPDITDSNGVDMGQIVNCQYVCNAINAKWGTSYTPVAGTASQAANCEYLLKLIDKANNNTTTFGTSAYATKQVADKTAVDTAVNRLWVPGKKFVAACYSYGMFYSIDGINWTFSSSSYGSALYTAVTYGNGKFVTVATGNADSAYSTDGIQWTKIKILVGSLDDVTYGNGKFVAVGNSKAAYSTDGINWNPATIPSTNIWAHVTYGNGKFVAVGYSGTQNGLPGGEAIYSTDGINWNLAIIPNSGKWHAVTYGNGKFVTVAGGNYIEDKAAYSTDGINWNMVTIPSGGWYDATYGNGKFVAVGYNNDINKQAAYSTDGINWNPAKMPNSASWKCVTYANGKFVAIAQNSDNAAYSEDGINWTAATMPRSGQWVSITYGGE